MKAILLILGLLLCGMDNFTPIQPPPYRPRPPHRDITCYAQDSGHEEHYGGHRSCRECLRQHSRCLEICQELTQRHYCQVRGFSRNNNYRFTGTGHSRREALDQAVRLCYRAGYNTCRLEQCWHDRRENVVSRSWCRGGNHNLLGGEIVL
jgi:hypothetical protein